MQEHGIFLLEWLLSKPAPQAILVVTLVGSIGLLSYGIFKGKPPIFKEADLDEPGRKFCLILGSILLVGFGLTLTIPVIYDIISNKDITIFIGDKEKTDDISLIAITKDGMRAPGNISIKLGRSKSGKELLSIEQAAEKFDVYNGPLQLVGKQQERQLFLKNKDKWRLYIANDIGKIYGPIVLKDSKNKTLMEIPTYNYANIIFPERGRIEFFNTKIFYSDQGSTDIKLIELGGEIDFNKFDYGESATSIIKRFKLPILISATALNDGDKGNRTASGQLYNPDEHVASSSTFPLGSILLITDPLKRDSDVKVLINDRGPNLLSLSSGALKKLGYPIGTNTRLYVRYVDYLFKKKLVCR